MQEFFFFFFFFFFSNIAVATMRYCGKSTVKHQYKTFYIVELFTKKNIHIEFSLEMQ